MRIRRAWRNMVRVLRSRLDPHLPVRCREEEVSLVGELPDGTWITRKTFRLESRA